MENTATFTPSKIPRRKIMSRDYASSAIKTSLAWQSGTAKDTDEKTMQKLRGKFHATCEKAKVGKEVEEMLWESMVPELKNPALGQFCLEAKAMESEFFPRWLWLIKNQQIAIACEPATGFSEDLHGKLREIPEDDPMRIWVHDPVFQYLAYRIDATARSMAEYNKILILGAGALPELRHTDYRKNFWHEGQHILCCDSDPTISPETLLDKKLLPAVEYQKLDAVSMFQKLMTGKGEVGSFDFIVANGMLSYCIDKMPVIIGTCLQLLKPGGTFQFDLQLAHWTLVRNKFLFGWTAGGSFKLIETIASAKETIQTTAAGLNLPTSCLEFTVPDIQGEEVGIICRLKKPL